MRKEDIKRVVVRLEKLPTLSGVATKLLLTTVEEQTDAAKIARIIESDQALVARILRLVNSPAYGFSGRVTTVANGVSLLGFSAVRSLVLSLTLADVFPHAHDPKSPFDRVAFWKHSLGCAVCAELIAEKTASDYAPEAFIAGLIHDIGKLALDVCAHDDFMKCVRTAQERGTYLVEVERELLDTDHANIGKWVAEQWGLPEKYVEAVWLHHQPVETLTGDTVVRRLIEIVQAANAVCRGLMIGASGDLQVHPVPDSLLASLRLKPKALDNIRARVVPEVEKRAALFDLKTDSNEIYLDSVQKAASELGRMSVEADERNRQLHGKVRVLSLLDEMNRTIQPGDGLDRILGTVARLLQDGMGVGRGLCLVVDKAESVLEGKVWREDDKSSRDLLLRLGGSGRDADVDLKTLDRDIAKTVAETALELEGSEWVGEQIKDIIERNDLLVVPMLSHSRSLGQIMIDVRSLDGRVTDNELEDLLAFAGGAALAVARHKLQARLNARSEELAAAVWRQEVTYKQLMRSERLASVGKMAAGAAHEINNPLAVISGRAQILLESEDDAKRQRSLELIVEQAQRASKILTDLMGFARPAMPKTNPVNINYIVHQVLSMVENQLRLKNIVCVREFTEGLPKILADRHQLEQVFLNMVLNSEHAMEEGGTITVSTSLATDGSAVVIRFADVGKGIPPEHIEQIFEPFFSTKEEGQGTGLGLSMCYGIITSHEGTISVDSEVGKGTTFTIRLPVPQDIEKAAPRGERPVAVPAGEERRATVLVVDDEANIRDILAETLTNLGYNVLTAEHGVAALGLLNSEHVDVMLLDMRMPLKDGLSLLAEIRDRLPTLPVVLITGLASHEEVEEALHIGAFSCIRKPFNIETLRSEVERALERDKES